MTQTAWRACLELKPSYPSQAVRAAVLVLLEARGRALTYRDMADAATKRGLWGHDGETPVNTLARDIRIDMERAAAAGEVSVFAISGGRPVFVSLNYAAATTRAGGEGTAELHTVLRNVQRMHPRAVEELVAELLWRVGYRDVSLTPYSGDGGIDVTASFPCGPVSHQRFAFQVKRCGQRVGQRTVRELRGVLADDDVRGVLVATGGVNSGARRVATEGRRPIVVIDGDALASLLLEHGLAPCSSARA